MACGLEQTHHTPHNRCEVSTIIYVFRTGQCSGHTCYARPEVTMRFRKEKRQMCTLDKLFPDGCKYKVLLLKTLRLSNRGNRVIFETQPVDL